MLQLLYVTTLTMSLTFMFLNHPLSMGLTLLIQTITISLITGLMSHNFWFSYILFMIMVGGMLVLFIYMTSVASNEKFNFSNKLFMMIMVIMSVSIPLMLEESFLTYQLNLNTDTGKSSMLMMFSLSMSKYLNMPSNWIMIMMIIYLLITLIAVVKITNISYGPLRQKF